MKTVDKAFQLLDQFSVERKEIGLSELARLAAIDKAATRRLLVALSKHGFIEQVPETRKYRLGHGFLRLATIREATVPMVKAAEDVCDWLVEAAEETVHLGVPGTRGISTIAHRLPRRSNVINIEPSQLLSYHATASGIAYLSGAKPQTVEDLLLLPREKLTPGTLTDEADLRAKMSEARARGYAISRRTFEEEVSGMAMPFFQERANPAGTIAIALRQEDLSDARRAELLPLLKEAVRRMERALTGVS